MNANQLEQLLLLEQSGELSSKQRRQLETALGAEADARRLRDELRQLAAVLPAPGAQPAPNAAARIAARVGQQPKRAFAFSPAWKPALAAAAALALLLGVRAFRPHPAPADVAGVAASAQTPEEEAWSDPLETEFTELESLIAALAAGDSLEMTEL